MAIMTRRGGIVGVAGVESSRPRRRRGRPGRAARRGYALLELTASILMLAAVMTMVVQLLGATVREHRAVQRRAWAAQEAANVLERLTALPWDRLTAEGVDETRLGSAIRSALPGGALRVEIQNAPPEGRLKRVAVQVHWRGRAGTPEAPVRLTAWVARREEAP